MYINEIRTLGCTKYKDNDRGVQIVCKNNRLCNSIHSIVVSMSLIK